MSEIKKKVEIEEKQYFLYYRRKNEEWGWGKIIK